MIAIKVGEVIGFGNGIFVVSGFHYVDGELALNLKPLTDDKENIDALNRALANPEGCDDADCLCHLTEKL